MTAFKRDRLAPEHYEAAVASMAQLNAAAARVMLRYEVHAATDITGFGLVGHASKMADGSGVTLRIRGIRSAAAARRARMLPRGNDSRRRTRNREFYGRSRENFRRSGADEMAEIVFDPQTSGGLLIALPEPQALPLLAELQAAGNLEAAVVGRVVEQTGFAIDLV